MKILANPEIDTRAILFDGKIAGHVVCFIKEEKRQIGYLIDRKFWGRGIATRAMELFLADLSERPLYASTSWDNLASMRILEKCGFARSGKTRSYGNARGCEIEEILWMLE
jgi:RimJ/RimL family protein N-acetyltransferase